ncbi:MAG: polyprenol monophosphomannose synthase [bacterium]
MKPVVFVPTYNEAPNVARLTAEIRRALPEATVLVVDDRSPDGTGEIADRLAAEDPAVRVLHRDPPKGRGLAGRDGYVEALRLGADVVIEMDADFSHPPALLPRMIREIEHGADVVLGSRFVRGGSDLDRGAARRIVTVLANTYIRVVLGVPVLDCNSGYRAFRRSALEKIRPDTLTSVGPSIVQEVLFRAHRAHARIMEIPLEFVDRKDGDSKLSLSLLFDGYVMILKLKLLALLGRNP